MQGHLDQFEVYGNDFPTADGTAVRDYIHVTDLAHAHVLALRIYCEAVPAARSICGTGYSVSQVLNAIARIAGRAFFRRVARR